MLVAACSGQRAREERGPGMVTARGNEPFWAVSISPSAIVYRTPALLPDSLVFPLVVPVSDSGSHTWTTSTSGRTLTLRITREPCQDTMSGQDFAWRAAIEVDSTSATGCASVTEGVPR